MYLDPDVQPTADLTLVWLFNSVVFVLIHFSDLAIRWWLFARTDTWNGPLCDAAASHEVALQHHDWPEGWRYLSADWHHATYTATMTQTTIVTFFVCLGLFGFTPFEVFLSKETSRSTLPSPFDLSSSTQTNFVLRKNTHSFMFNPLCSGTVLKQLEKTVLLMLLLRVTCDIPQ